MRGGLFNCASGLAFVAAAALLSGGAVLVPQAARAADLGGDCCADLEERVAELEATTARKGNRNVSLTVSGRVHANVMYWSESPALLDAGYPYDHHSDVYFGNAGGSGPNLNFKGAASIRSDLIAGFSMTLSDDFGGTNNQISHQGHPAGGPGGDATYVYLAGKSWGELRLGNMSSASDNAYYLNYGNATVAGLAGARFVGAFSLRDVNGKLTDVTYGQLLQEWSDNRENRLMYISPMLGGLKLYADVGGDDTASVAATYVAKYGSVLVESGIGYQTSTRSDGVTHQTQNGSSTAFRPLTDAANSNLREFGMSSSIWDTNSGLFLSTEYNKAYAAIAGRQDITNWFVEGGWQKNVSGLGITSLYAQYMRQDNALRNDTTAHLFGVGIDQAIDAAAANVYVHYQRDSYDTDGKISTAGCVDPTLECVAGPVNAQSIDSVTGGMIIRF
jgi:hypothetical protein